jgi:hypothetical protein
MTDHTPQDHEPLVDRATDWLNDHLRPYIGPPPLGPYDPESKELESSKSCPICGFPISEHRRETDPESGHCYLYHPTDEFPGPLQVT